MIFPFFSKHGVLGLNARSLLYIRPFNPKKAIAFADSKIKTKAYLAARGIPVAKVYGRIETREQARTFDFSQLPDECVLKPNFGFGGEGILVFRGRNKQKEFLRNGKESMSEQELREHIEDILDGKFSVNGKRDIAFFEQILIPHQCFARFRPAGLPDIRVIVFNLVPVMAMLRIPTAESDGKANVHLGGIGIGIDIAKGTTTYAAQYHNMVKELTHGEQIAGHKIPYWEDILLVCSKIQQITNIGYLAVDITIDETMGPALLEVNARAGLMVQVANLAPLRSRLERVKGLKISTPEKGVRVGQDLFGEKSKEVATSDAEPDRPLLGIHESIDITLGDGSSIEVPCRIAGDQERTVFSKDLIAELAKNNGIEPAEQEGLYKVKFTLKGKKMQTVVAEEDTKEERARIGRRDLSGFLIDPTKVAPVPLKKTLIKTDLRAVDKLLGNIDRDLLLLKYIKPINLQEEMQRLREDSLYNAVFSYGEIPVDFEDIKERLREPVQGDTPLAQLLEKKRVELQRRLSLLQGRGKREAFTVASSNLFGTPTQELLKTAQEELDAREACALPADPSLLMTAEEAVPLFEEQLTKYGLHTWQVVVRERLVADCTVGGHTIYLRQAATFTPENIASLIAHEIETHVLTAENGNHQPYLLLRRGTANYLDTQEGLAIYNQNRVINIFDEKRYNPQRNLLGLAYSLRHSLAETRTYLRQELGYSEEKALTQSVMMKRGLIDTSEPGGFTKGIVYFRGVRAIQEFVRTGGDLKRLYIGKVSLEDLDRIEKIPDLEKPLLIPTFLREGTVEKKKKAQPKKAAVEKDTKEQSE